MSNGLSTLLRLISRIACLIVIASFALFANDQANSASTHQQNEVNSAATPGAATPKKKKKPANHKSGVRNAIDEAAETLTSPFSSIASGSSNTWAVHVIDLVLVLLVYGFGLGFLARVVRVRV